MNRFGLLSRAHRKRYREVLSVLAKNGLDEFLSSSQAGQIPLISRLRLKDQEIAKLSRWARLRLSIEELGGAYVKAGQILSNRPDLIPEELLIELEKLQDAVLPFSSVKAKKIIREELGVPLADVFLLLDDEPLASASIAQVHRAVLLDGSPVVIKVRRPGLASKFKIDLDVITYFSQHLKRSSEVGAQFKERNPIKEIRREIEKELDFVNEASNIEHFAGNFEGDESVYVPKIYKQYCTEKILVMEYVDGIKATDIKALKSSENDLELVANNIVDAGLKQIFDHRFFHGDPHPGNVVIFNNKICFLDFGLVGRLSTRQHQILVDLVVAFSQRDARKITRIISKSIPKSTNFDSEKLESEVAELMDVYFDMSISEIHVGDLLKSVLNLMYTYDLTFQSNIYILVKAAMSYEGIALKLYPEFQISVHAQKYAKKIIRQRLAPHKIAKDLYFSTTETVALLRDFPSEARNLLHLLQAGRLSININVVDLKETVDYTFSRVDKITNRIAYTILLSALVMGSSIVISTDVGNEVFGVSLFGAIGFIVAILMAIYLLITIIRSRGL